MKQQEVTRKEFVQIYEGVSEISKSGKLKFSDWLDVETTRQNFEKQYTDHETIFKKIMDDTGYTDYVKRAQQAELKGESYLHSEKDLLIVEEFQEKQRLFSESMISIKFNEISHDVLEKLPADVLHVRAKVFKLIKLKTDHNSKKTLKNA